MSNSLLLPSSSQKELTPNAHTTHWDNSRVSRDTSAEESSGRMTSPLQLNKEHCPQIKAGSLFAELKRRKVYKVATAYGVVSWLLIQAASIFLPTFEAPPCFMKMMVVLVALGFVVSVILSWIFDITPQGIKRTADMPLAEAVDIVRQLEAQVQHEFVRGYLCALLYGGPKDNMETIDYLKHEYPNGTDINPTGGSVDVMLDQMRTDPRFQKFFRRRQ